MPFFFFLTISFASNFFLNIATDGCCWVNDSHDRDLRFWWTLNYLIALIVPSHCTHELVCKIVWFRFFFCFAKWDNFKLMFIHHFKSVSKSVLGHSTLWWFIASSLACLHNITILNCSSCSSFFFLLSRIHNLMIILFLSLPFATMVLYSCLL